MNKYINVYQSCRDEGKSEYEALGTAASYVAVLGTMDDLQEVYEYFQDDFMESVDQWLARAIEVSQKIKLEESNYETA